FLYVGFVISVYAIARMHLRRPAAILLSLTTAAIPSVINWVPSGDADLLLILFYSAAILALMQIARDDNWRLDVLYAAFCALAMMTKHEGKLMAILVLGSGIALRGLRSLRRSIRMPLVALAIYLPWLLWSLELPQTHENYLARLRWSIFVANADRIKP